MRPAKRTASSEAMPPRHHTLAQRLQEQIVEYVIEQGIQPGERLPTEPELCRIFDVSRTAVREGMKCLEILGVVSIEPGRGTFLLPFDVGTLLSHLPTRLLFRRQDLIEVTRVRHTLEELCLEQAVLNADDADVAELESCVKAMEARADAGETMEDEDIAFHRQLAQMADARLLLIILEVFWDLRRRFPMKNSPEALRLRAQRHRRLYRAFQRRDLLLARLALSDHFAGSYAEMIDNLEEDDAPEYLTLRAAPAGVRTDN